jgi:uncharacterized protein YaaN involved in tellurite resistance
MRAIKRETHLQQVWQKLRAHVDAGEISEEDAAAKMTQIKQQMAAQAQTAARLRQAWSDLRAQVEAGTLSQEEAEARMGAIKREAFAGPKGDGR